MAKIKIGYAPTRRSVFSAEAARSQRGLIKDYIKDLADVELIDIDDINEEGLLYEEKYFDAIVKKFSDAKVDGLFIPHCNFGTEAMVGRLSKAIGKPVLIWGPRDDMPLDNGVRTRDTQCGLFASGKVLRRFNVPFTYLQNCDMKDAAFTEGYKKWVAVVNVVKQFTKLRILQISTRPDSFWTMIVNESELLEKFGIEVFPITVMDVANGTRAIMKEGGEAYLSEVKSLEKRFSLMPEVTNEDVKKIAALKLYMSSACAQYSCTSVAIQCWNALPDDLGVMPCLANGLLAEEGIPVVCETDIHGAVTAIMLQAAAMDEKPIFFADFTIRNPQNDNSELLWHCGNYPPSLAENPEGLAIDKQFVLDSHHPGTGEFKLRDGDITICRFDGDNGKYQLFIGEGETCDGPMTKGTYVWFLANDWPLWEEKLVCGPYVHHCAGIYGKYAAVLYEACRYIPQLCADPVNPTASEIERAWREGK